MTKPQKPKIGDLAVCSFGYLGIIECDEPQEVKYLNEDQGIAWIGTTVLPFEKSGNPWSSRNPRVIGNIDELHIKERE